MENKSLKELTLITSSSDPVPGGGGISGAVGSLAASLSIMVTNLTIGKKKYLEYTSELEDIKDKATELREELLASLNGDAKAFYPLSKAYAMDKNDPMYQETMEKCLKDAANSPYTILLACAKVIDLDLRLADIGSKLSVSDAGTSVSLAIGALKGAYLNVKVNTSLMGDKVYAKELEDKCLEIVNEYSIKADDCYKKVLERL